DFKHRVRFPPLRKPPAADQQEVEQHVREMEAGFKALTDVYTRHELTEDTFRNVADALRELDPAQPDVRRFRRMLVSSGERLKDPGAFLHEGVLALSKLAGGKDDPGADLGSAATLTNLRVRGGAADAVLEFADGKSMPLHFTKTPAGWRIALPD